MKYRVLVEAPYLTMSGYGEHSRLVLEAMRSDDKFDIYGLPLEWGSTSWLSSNDSSREWLDSISIKTLETENKEFDLHVFVGIPSEFTKKAPKAVCVTAGIEVDRVDPSWLLKSFEIDKIIVPSEYSKSVFLNSTYETDQSKEKKIQPLTCHAPVQVVPYSVREYEPSKTMDLKFDTKFNFLNVAQWGPRKNLDLCIKWFVENFHDNEDVGLILKTNLARNCLMDRDATHGTLKSILSTIDPNNSRKCKIYLLHGDLTEGELADLYTNDSVKAMISTTHGEGFGLPLFEAVCHKIPVLATNATGHIDFLYCPDKDDKVSAHFAKVDFTVEKVPPAAVWEGIISAESRWVCPIESSFKNALNSIYDDYDSFTEKSERLYNFVTQKFSKQTVNDLMVDSIKSIMVDENKNEVEDINTRIFS